MRRHHPAGRNLVRGNSPRAARDRRRDRGVRSLPHRRQLGRGVSRSWLRRRGAGAEPAAANRVRRAGAARQREHVRRVPARARRPRAAGVVQVLALNGYALFVIPRSELVDLFHRVVDALSAERLVREACASGKVPRPLPGGRLVALGIGKAAARMLAGARAAVAVEPPGFAGRAGAAAPPILLGGSHPVPDEGSFRAGGALLSAAQSLGPRDAALWLVSGGGSALAEVPRSGLGLVDVRAVNEALLGSGAPIEEMNCVRAHLSRLKGGGLAKVLYAAGVRNARALVLVDVPRRGAAAVSSGPAAADPTTFADARDIVRARSVQLPAAAAALLERGEETLKPGEPADFVPHEVLCDMASPAREAARLWSGRSEIA